MVNLCFPSDSRCRTQPRRKRRDIAIRQEFGQSRVGRQRDQEHTLGDGDALKKGKAKEKLGHLCGPLALPKCACDPSVATQLKPKIEFLSLSTKKQSVFVMTLYCGTA